MYTDLREDRRNGSQEIEVNKVLVKNIRELAKDSQEIEVSLPIEIVDIIEGKRKEVSWKKIDISKVINYLASMLED